MPQKRPTLKSVCPTIAMKGGIGSEDIRAKSVTTANLADGVVTAEKINASLKSNAINNLSSGAELSDVINAVSHPRLKSWACSSKPLQGLLTEAHPPAYLGNQRLQKYLADIDCCV